MQDRSRVCCLATLRQCKEQKCIVHVFMRRCSAARQRLDALQTDRGGQQQQLLQQLARVADRGAPVLLTLVIVSYLCRMTASSRTMLLFTPAGTRAV